MGLDNPAFQDISYSIEEKGSSDGFAGKSSKKSPEGPPKVDELIKIIQFEPPINRCLTI
jgi:hypothetical protein